MRIRAGVLAVFLSGLIFPAAAFADCSDYPDPYYEDINGDGIDGDTAIAVFVSGAAGNDANPGTMLSPVATIARGIFLADSTGRAHVYVAGGTYIGTVSMADGVSLYGQYDGPPGWGRSGANTTTVSDTGTAVLASNITVETHLEGFAIVSTTNASERTGFGIRVVNGNGPLYVRYNSVMPGTGLDGQAGGNGGPGTNGGPGGPGGEGVCNGFGPGPGGAPGFSACGRNGGMGGQGGSPGNNGQPGNPGNIGTPGGPPGPSGDPGLAGGNGGNGTSGANGADGAGGSGYTITGGGYAASEGLAGTSGSAGNGGGGG
ncbi:MAG TPA: hypothetical protein VNL73_07785, partial [Verrucomicrobiae bacterium]|nr:hypothetical protein [Verrucomicrobiae bacterium]